MRIREIPYKLKKAVRYFRHFGPKAFFAHLRERLEPEDVPYGPWYEKHRPTEEALHLLRRKNREDDPLISVVVPAYETPERFLSEMIGSVAAQTYENWELVIADASDRTDRVRKCAEEAAKNDPRIRYVRLAKNDGISANTNAAVLASHGVYVGFLDHDDLLAPQALRRMADAVLSQGADLLYSDEDKIKDDGKTHFQPHWKPSFNLDLLRSNNYVTHFLVVKRTLLDKAGLFRPEFDGAQDHDLIFRCAEAAEKIVRIPEVLYHWRTHASSTADNPDSKQYAYDAGRRAIASHLARTGTEGEVSCLPEYGFYRVKYPVKGEPLISVIIPNRDHAEDLKRCIDALRGTAWKKREILIVENGSEEAETFEYYRTLGEDPDVRILTWDKGFNYAAINNYAAGKAEGEYLLFLNNDVRTSIDPGCIEEMLGVAQRPEVGAVGAKLYYPDDRIQHAGIVIGMGGIAGAMFVDLPRTYSGYLHKASILQDMSAVTGAMMMVPKDVFFEAGGFTEELAVAFNDVDLCLKIREKGYLVVYDPYAEAYHDESRTRGPEDTEEKVRRFQGEIEYMRTRWEKLLRDGDPYYDPNLSLSKWNYSLRP